MAKKIQGDDGKTYVEKKPFYKRVWFWVVVVILAFAIGGAMGSNSNGGTKEIHQVQLQKSLIFIKLAIL